MRTLGELEKVKYSKAKHYLCLFVTHGCANWIPCDWMGSGFCSELDALDYLMENGEIAAVVEIEHPADAFIRLYEKPCDESK